MVKGWITACAIAACAAAPPRPSAALPPAGAAVIAHEETGDRLYVADFAGGKLRPVGPAGEAPHQPVWSLDGTHLAWRAGNRLWLHTEGGDDAAVVDGVEIETQRPCAFSPDGRLLAVAGAGGAVLLASEHGEPRPLLARPGVRVGDLIWLPDGGTLAVLFWAPGRAEVVQVAIADGAAKSQRTDDVSRLLGFRPDGGLLVLRSAEGREQLAVLGPAGLSPLRSLPEGQSVIDYAAAGDRLLLAASGEDSGDDAAVFLAAAGGAPPRRWLASHPQLVDLRLSRDGRWALFVDRAVGAEGRPGGSVFLVAVGSASAKSVLPASGARSFSEPTPRPRSRFPR